MIPLATSFFLTALAYASVGFGGGSTYLALLVLFALPYAAIPQIALLCNIIVVTGGCYHFYRAGLLSVRRILPFIVASIPCAYLGGRIPIAKEDFLWLLALTLGVAGVRLFLRGHQAATSHHDSTQRDWAVGLPVGAVLGLLSGLVGIGGGIFLSPILFFIRWGTARHIAAAASGFILLNSIAGLCGQWSKTGWAIEWEWMFPLAVAVLCGGQIGSRLATGWLPMTGLRRLTALFVLSVSGRILWGLV
jgi:uncharacterized protein